MKENIGTADRFARWMMWAIVMLFAVPALALMTFLLGWSIIDKFGGSSFTMWMAALALCYCVAVWFVGKKLLNSILFPPPEISLKLWGGRAVGAMRGLLAGGIADALIFALLWAIRPDWLFLAQSRIFFGVVIFGSALFFALRFPAKQIFRRERIWLAVTLAAGIFLAHLLTGIFILYPMKFDYRAQTVTPQAFPLVSDASLKKILPQGTTDIHLRGWRGYAPYIEWECTVKPAEFAAFVKTHGYEFTADNSIREIQKQKFDLAELIVPPGGKRPTKFDFCARFNSEGLLVTVMLYDRTTGRFIGRTQ